MDLRLVVVCNYDGCNKYCFVAINENDLILNSYLYPNPSNGSFNIPDDLIGKAFVLYTSDGQQAKTGLLDSQIDLSMLKSGTYLLQVTAYSFTLVKN